MTLPPVPWLDDVIVWHELVPNEGRWLLGARWADVTGVEHRMKIDVTRWEGKSVPRCDARQPDRRLFCPLWPNHDGPHVAATEELDRSVGGFTITGMHSA